MKKLFFLFLLVPVFQSCNKDDDSSERQLTPTNETMVGEWVYTSVIRANGVEESYPHRCSSNKDYAKILLNTYITASYYDQNCTPFFLNCNNYFFEGNRIKNCFLEFDEARVTYLTETTMRLEYDNERSFGALGFNVKGLILKKR